MSTSHLSSSKKSDTDVWIYINRDGSSFHLDIFGKDRDYLGRVSFTEQPLGIIRRAGLLYRILSAILALPRVRFIHGAPPRER